MRRERVIPAPENHQEIMLAVLALDQKWGAPVAAQVNAGLFNEDYRPLAEQLLDYWTRYNRPPGRAHLDDLLDPSLKPEKLQSLQRVLAQIVTAADEGLNGQYVAERTHKWVRQQQLRQTIIKAADRIGQGGAGAEDDVENMLYETLRARPAQIEAGLFLSDKAGFDFLDRERNCYPLNIPELDRRGIGPAPGQMLLYIGPKGSGKSWFCVHVGRCCRLAHLRVMHITLEMSQELVFQRYMQAWFGVAKFNEKQAISLLEFDELGRLKAIPTERRKPKLSLSDPGIRSILQKKQASWGARFKGLVIRRFPTSQLTLPSLIGYLDYMEQVQKFIPQVLIVDYPDLMATDPKNYRMSLGSIYEGLRGIAVDRNLALVVPTQSTRGTIKGRRTRSSDVSEDKRKIDTADNVLAYSSTEMETKYGLARLTCEHARDAEDGFMVMLTQNYHSGQYVLQSAPMMKQYWDLVEAKAGKTGSKDDE